MAINITTPAVGSFGFFANGTSVDLSDVEELKAAPVAGLSIYIDYLTISSGAAIDVTIGEGETTPGAIDTVLLGPITFAEGQCIQWTFLNGGMKLTAITSLVVGASGAGDVCVFASGRVQ